MMGLLCQKWSLAWVSGEGGALSCVMSSGGSTNSETVWGRCTPHGIDHRHRPDKGTGPYSGHGNDLTRVHRPHTVSEFVEPPDDITHDSAPPSPDTHASDHF